MKLPQPPSLEELEANTPRIAPVSSEMSRPFWSVMIPTYNAGEYLRRTLTSILDQDQGPARMHIEVVDGGSTKDDPRAVVEEIGKGRVEYYRLPENRGPGHTFNTCLHRSRGHWVHILHGDDLVLPGFYGAYGDVIAANPQVRSVVGQVVMIDKDDRWDAVWGPRPPRRGTNLVPDFAEREAIDQLVQAPAVVAHREVYEAVGGFCTWFDHVLDWDMYFRLAHYGPVGCVDRPFAGFRLHDQSHSVTSPMMVNASTAREAYCVVRANLERLQKTLTPDQEREWRGRLAAKAERHLRDIDEKVPEGRFNQAAWAWMLDPSPRRLAVLAKLWLNHKLHPSAVRA